MAPTTSSILLPSSNPSPTRYHHHRQASVLLRHPAPHAGRLLDAAQPSVVLEGPPPPQIATLPSDSLAPAPEPSVVPANGGQLQASNLPEDIPGGIVAAIVVVVLVLGGLIGLVIGGEMLRQRARSTGERVTIPSRWLGCTKPKPKPIKNATKPKEEHIEITHEKFPQDERKLIPLARPPPVLNREHQRRFTDVWPIHGLSKAFSSRRSCPEQVERSLRHSAPPIAAPQTTWSEFTPVTLYVPPPRTILARITEELEESENENSDFDTGVRSSRTEQPKLNRSPESSTNPKPLIIAEPHGSKDFQTIHPIMMKDEDSKSLGSSAPDMTSDEGESNRSSIVSLESLEDKNDGESLREEVFELRRAQTRSMQMNKGVLLSFSLNSTLNLNDARNLELTDEKLGTCGSSRLSCATGVTEGGKCYMERGLSLAMLGGSFSAVNLDEFPSPPSILPVIPSFVSDF